MFVGEPRGHASQEWAVGLVGELWLSCEVRPLGVFALGLP